MPWTTAAIFWRSASNGSVGKGAAWDSPFVSGPPVIGAPRTARSSKTLSLASIAFINATSRSRSARSATTSACTTSIGDGSANAFFRSRCLRTRSVGLSAMTYASNRY